MSDLVTINQASKLLGVHPNTLRNWDRSGYLGAVRVGKRGDRRYRTSDIRKLTRKSYVSSESEVSNVRKVREEYFQKYVPYIVEWANLDKDSVVIDVPCGTGQLCETLNSYAVGSKYYLVDVNEHMVEEAKKKVKNAIPIVGDASKIDALVNDKVDALICLNGFHQYFEDKVAFLKGANKVLKKNGVLILDVSTRGMWDKQSKLFLAEQRKQLEHLAVKHGAKLELPDWPNESLLSKYRRLIERMGFNLSETVTFDRWFPFDELISQTLSIKGRIRPWLPDLDDETRVSVYKEASERAKRKIKIDKLNHNRIFFIARKESQ